jgi:hypothetical protein
VDRSVVMPADPGELYVLGPAAERRVVWGLQVQAHQPKQRRDEALGLPKGQVEDRPQGQGSQDCRVRVAALPSATAVRRRRPGPDGLPGEPDGDVTSSA